VFQQLLLFALSRILKTAWKYCRKKTPSYHTLTPTISKECNGRVPKKEKKESLPGKVQTYCPLRGISQNSHVKLDVWEGLVWKKEEKGYVF